MSPRRWTAQPYIRHITELLRKTGCAINHYDVNFVHVDRQNVQVDGEGIRFRPADVLTFAELIRVPSSGDIEILEYSYHFEWANGQFFRYDRAPDDHIAIIHEECHLHVCDIKDSNERELRFKTHATNFEEVLSFIMQCFCTK